MRCVRGFVESGAPVLFAATSLWGVFSASLALFGSRDVGPVVAVGAALPLLIAATLRGRRPFREMMRNLRLYLGLGVLEGANIAFYVAALAIGPAPVVVALHLASPIMLLALAVVANQRVTDLRMAVQGLLLIVAISLVSFAPSGDIGVLRTLLGCCLALGSAAAVTALITLVGRKSRQHDPTVAAGLQLLLAGVLTVPLLGVEPWDESKLVVGLVLGAALLGPGFALYWIAMRRLTAPAAGIIGLNEALVASVVVAILDRAQITSVTITAGLLILIAVVLELPSRV
jgi:drug/metabolite transporter (DMT)-like permease